MKLPGPGFPYASFALVLAAQSLATATRPLDIGAKSDRHQLVAGGAVDFEDALVKTKTTSESSESNPGSALTAAPQKGTSNSGKGALQTGSKEGGLSAHQEEALPGPASRKKRAYATLLYSDFIHGTRALGQSLRESGTVADTVVLVTPDVRKETRDKLADDGWIVRPVEVEENPNENFQSRLVFVYTKLLIVEMEDEYERVVFLDADTLVLENIDELFECQPFCAVMRHSELLNSGVVVITPSKALHGHMHDLIGQLDSYTGGDQGFLNSFYPYFAACPAFEPYPIVGSRLSGIGSGLQSDLVQSDLGRALGGVGGNGGSEQVVPKQPQGWGCKRLPTRYNGDWPLLFVDGDLQVVQGKEAGPEAPADWKRRKKVKVLHFTFGTAKPWDWWTYPFLPYVDLWLEAFHRVEQQEREGRGHETRRLREVHKKEAEVEEGGGNDGGGGSWNIISRAGGRTGGGRGKRPRWSGVVGQLAWGLSPLVLVAFLWRGLKRWSNGYRTLHNLAMFLARFTVPLKALSTRSLVGSIFNLSVGLTLGLSAAVLAFSAVPAERLGAGRPEAAWAFFGARATALIVLFEGMYLMLVLLKAHFVFNLSSSPVQENGTPYVGSIASTTTLVGSDFDKISNNNNISSSSSHAHHVSSGGGGGGRRVGGGDVDMEELLGGKKVGGSVGGGICGPRRLALTETVAHLVVLSIMTASLVSAPLWVGLNGFPASREVIPGLLRLLALLVVFTFSAVRLPPLWVAHFKAWDGNHRGRRKSWNDPRETEAARTALGNLSPLSDHHNA